MVVNIVLFSVGAVSTQIQAFFAFDAEVLVTSTHGRIRRVVSSGEVSVSEAQRGQLVRSEDV